MMRTARRRLADSAVGAVHWTNDRLRTLDRALFAPPPCEEPGPVFMVGAARSGSTLTFQVLTQALHVTYLPKALDYAYGLTHLAFRTFRAQLARPEPIFTSSYGSTPGLLSPSEAFGYWRTWFPIGPDGVHFNAPCLAADRARDMHAAVGAVQGHLRAPLLVKCFYLSFAVEALAAAIPNALFVLNKRDPLAVAASMLRTRLRDPDADWWSLRPPGYRDVQRESVADQVVWQVAEVNRIVNASLARLPPERWRTSRFEDLCRAPTRSIETLLDWLAPLGYARRVAPTIPDRFSIPPAAEARERELLEQSRHYAALVEHAS